MPKFSSDEILWYNVGVWGELGYACPNFGNDPATLNGSINYLVAVMGRNLSAVMHHRDADLRVPPSINTLMRVHKLCTRARSILSGRAVPENKPNFEAIHATPSKEPFLIYPVPYFRVRNMWLKEWTGLILNAISEACQHTENAKEYEISLTFAGLIGQYIQRVYVRMATELLLVPLSEAEKPDYSIPETVFQSYNPSKYFTQTELIDTVPDFEAIPTEDDLAVITDGLPASMIVGLTPWPRGLSTNGPNTQPASSSGSFAPPPGV